MKKTKTKLLLALLPLGAILLALRPATPLPAWGFFGHRKINRMAVFTLPPEMLVFYKKNVDWLTQHAVDADNHGTRPATKHPAISLTSTGTGNPPTKTFLAIGRMP